MDKVSKKVDKKMREAGWLSPGEEVRIGVVTFPLGNTKGGGGTATPTGIVTDLLVVGPLQRKLGKALYGDEDKDVLAELVPEKAAAAAGMNTMLTATNQRFLVHEWKGFGKLGALYAESPLAGCTIVTEDGGKGPSKHRVIVATLSDGRWVVRELVLVGGGAKRVDALVEAFSISG